MADLKPCPFCGTTVKMNRSAGTEVYSQSWSIRCPTCGATQGCVYGSNSWNFNAEEDQSAQDKVTVQWNTRVEVVTEGAV